jgi:hypothetical protein
VTPLRVSRLRLLDFANANRREHGNAAVAKKARVKRREPDMSDATRLQAGLEFRFGSYPALGMCRRCHYGNRRKRNN